MSRLILSTFLLPLAVALIPASQVTAQPSAFGIGFYSGVPLSSPAIGIFPFYYRGFYGNGMSMYGPPVPTFSPVPGTYNGSDYTVNQSPPFWPISPRYYSARFNYDRDVTPLARLKPIATQEPPPAEQPNLPAPMPATAGLVMEVHLPVATAQVFVNGNPTKSTGDVRTYSSPALPAGENVAYEIRAEWVEKGEKVSLTRLTGGKAGERVIVDFVDR